MFGSHTVTPLPAGWEHYFRTSHNPPQVPTALWTPVTGLGQGNQWLEFQAAAQRTVSAWSSFHHNIHHELSVFTVLVRAGNKKNEREQEIDPRILIRAEAGRRWEKENRVLTEASEEHFLSCPLVGGQERGPSLPLQLFLDSPPLQITFPILSSPINTDTLTRVHTNVHTPSVSQFTQSCLTLCDPMDCSRPGLPVHHQLPELAQTHDH